MSSLTQDAQVDNEEDGEGGGDLDLDSDYDGESGSSKLPAVSDRQLRPNKKAKPSP